jgi:hypothetical protein
LRAHPNGASMRDMKQFITIAAILCASASLASAGGIAGSIGIGVEAMSNGLGGISGNYDAGKFHLGGFLAFNDPAGPTNTEFAIGGRFFYHVATTATTDFSIGGTIGLDSQGNPDPVGRQNFLFLEPGFQIRAFIATNVALSFTGGITIGTADADGVQIGGQVTGLAGVHYYF